MNKIPVGQTVASAYRFTFVGLEKVIGLIWLPIIVLTVADYFINGAFYTAQATALDTGDAARLGPMLVGQLGFQFVELTLKAMIAVAICREILKPVQRPLWLRFSLGGTEFRFMGATLALAALMGLAAVLCMIVGVVLASVMGLATPGMAAGQQALGFAVLLGLLFSPVLIYVFVRLGGLVLPATVMDGGLGLERSWTLVKGNVWRMIGVSLATGVPVTLVVFVLHGLIVGMDSFNPHLELMADQAAQLRHNAQILRQTADHLPLLEGVEFVLAPFLYGLVFSAPAFAYKALTEKAPPAP